MVKSGRVNKLWWLIAALLIAQFVWFSWTGDAEPLRAISEPVALPVIK